jgi:hypothetical protein
MKNSNSLVISTAALALALSASLTQAALTHIYSFNTDASDTIGGADGTLHGGASVAVGQLTLTGASDTYVELPAATIGVNNYSALSLEVWATPYPQALTSFSTLLGFGQVDPDNSNFAANYVILQTHRGDDVSRAAISNGNLSAPYAAESGANGPELNDGAEHYYAAVITATEISLYVDGVLTQTSPNNASLAAVSTEFAQIGAAYPADQKWAGHVNEVRIYDNALPAYAIEANYMAGPDGVIVVPEPSILALAGLGLVGVLTLRRKANS